MVFFWLVYKDVYKRTNARTRQVEAVTVANRKIKNIEGVEDVTSLLSRRAMKVDKVHFKGWFLAPVAYRTSDEDRPRRFKDETLAETLARMKSGETLRDVLTHHHPHNNTGDPRHDDRAAHNVASSRTSRTPSPAPKGKKPPPRHSYHLQEVAAKILHHEKRTSTNIKNEDEVKVSYGDENESSFSSHSAASEPLAAGTSSHTLKAANACREDHKIPIHWPRRRHSHGDDHDNSTTSSHHFGDKEVNISDRVHPILHWPRRRRSSSPDVSEGQISFGSNSESNSTGDEIKLATLKTSDSDDSRQSSKLHWPGSRYHRSQSPKPESISFGEDSESNSDPRSNDREPSFRFDAPAIRRPSIDDDISWSTESSKDRLPQTSSWRRRHRRRSVSPEAKREIGPLSDEWVDVDNDSGLSLGETYLRDGVEDTGSTIVNPLECTGSWQYDEGSASPSDVAVKPENSNAMPFEIGKHPVTDRASLVDTFATIPKTVRISERTVTVTTQPEQGCMKVGTLEESLAAKYGSNSRSKSRRKKYVGFENIAVREYTVCLGDNPACSSGPPISLSWEYNPQTKVMHVDDYESLRNKDGHLRRQETDLVMSREQREHILSKLGYTTRDLTKASIEKRQIQMMREDTIHKLKYMRMEERIERLKQCISPCCLQAKRVRRSSGLIW